MHADLFAESVAYKERIEVEVPGEEERVVLGFGRDGRLVLFFGEAGRCQFDAEHRLRIVDGDDNMYRSEGSHLSILSRQSQSPASTSEDKREAVLRRTALEGGELHEFLENLRGRLARVLRAISSTGPTRAIPDPKICRRFEEFLGPLLDAAITLSPPLVDRERARKNKG